ncbi:hypothetical protein CALCODRAFT_505411 [Calocera cornea HHB12733]|uniref:Uncharacterized protein n=1 Tax=Calocera cornea HHB12733 TaxID=1353952 RepID=A0A165K3Q4_9BASI|nr:hypothetical protein CALCODRAFT_505411 [Calocera cornea HHB12733]
MSDDGTSISEMHGLDNDPDGHADSDASAGDQAALVLDGFGEILNALKRADGGADDDGVATGTLQEGNASSLPVRDIPNVDQGLANAEDSMPSMGAGKTVASDASHALADSHDLAEQETVTPTKPVKKPVAAHVASHGHTFAPAVMLSHYAASSPYRYRRSASSRRRVHHSNTNSVWVDEALIEEDGDHAIGGALTDYLRARGETRGEAGEGAVSSEAGKGQESVREEAVKDGKDEKKETDDLKPAEQYQKAARKILSMVYGIDLDEIDVNAPPLANNHLATTEDKKNEENRRIVRAVLKSVKKNSEKIEAEWLRAADGMSDLQESKWGYTEWKAAWRGWWAVKQVRWSRANRKRMPPSAMLIGTIVFNAGALKRSVKKGIWDTAVGARKWGRFCWSAVKGASKATYRAGGNFAIAHKRTVLLVLAIVTVIVLTIILAKAPWLLPKIANWEDEIAQIVSMGANMTTLVSALPKEEL